MYQRDQRHICRGSGFARIFKRVVSKVTRKGLSDVIKKSTKKIASKSNLKKLMRIGKANLKKNPNLRKVIKQNVKSVLSSASDTTKRKTASKRKGKKKEE